MADVTRKTATAHVIKGALTKGYIGPWNYVHGPVRFEYVIPLPEDRRDFYRDVDLYKDDEDGVQKLQATWAIEFLRSWNQTYHDDHEKAGEPLPRTADCFLELDKRVQNRIVSIMLLQEQSELDPEDRTPEEVKNYAKTARKPLEERIAELQKKAEEAHAEQLGNSKGPSASS